eukprot:CAMPEP_0113628612 /NCGR_PEP_ID=MMETSP0017_2-20120614/14827_1 /TAXON_ID=2856 /ORGANISM="Cylindrotheca closterium" /LENGTH=456 /DNA_ID=CAMNT_0000538927 /DNA_START=125 /DNA_END=1495 /DNA_ORIENTATION=+ /assembly_acc=CAM_ASM_000147
MGKRGNDMSQLSKEEYEAAMAGGSSSSGGKDFARASNDVLSGRRILRTGSKWKKAKAAKAVPSIGGAGTGAATANPFDNFSFTKASASTSLTAPSIAAKTQTTSLGSSSSKPAFAMPSLATYNSSNSNKNMSLSQSLLSNKTTMQQSSGAQSDNSQLAKGFKDFIEKLDVRIDWRLPMSRYIDTYDNMKGSKQPSTTSSTISANAPTATTTTTPTFGSFGGTTSASVSASTGVSSTPSKPLFPPSTNARAPSLFSFGSTSASGGSSTSPKPTFAFGNPAASSPAPAPTTSTGFGFAFGGKTESTGSATTPTASTIPSEKENQDSSNKEEEDGSSTQQSADNDWNEVYSTKVKVYHHRENVAVAFAKGPLKLQELKSNVGVKRMVMRDIAGKVTLNVAISSSMNFAKTQQKTKSGSVVAKISFVGIRDTDRGGETLTMVCVAAHQDEFYGKLVEMST